MLPSHSLNIFVHMFHMYMCAFHLLCLTTSIGCGKSLIFNATTSILRNCSRIFYSSLNYSLHIILVDIN